MKQGMQTPQSIGGVLDSTFKLYKQSFRAVLAPIVVYVVATGLLALLGNLLAGTAMGIGAQMGLQFIAFVLVVIVSVWTMGGVVYRMNALAHDDGDGARRALEVARGKIGALVGFAVLYGVLTMLGFLLLVIPGIILCISLSLGGALILLEDEKVFRSISRSHKLVWGNWWRTAAIFTVIALIIMVPWILVGGLVAGVLVATDSLLYLASDHLPLHIEFFVLLATSVVEVVLMPLALASVVCVLHDLRARKEGTDLEERLATV
ncbi:MAG: hypothetical protein JJU06_00390 [Ectothiorhodospiraceae bacterium]|nr:hypothetical protein [Ectothiorhodospiraceae bacterium]MCH8506252.1 hypothetical protein [Ectothiorhodospiraceae bacterium]